MIRSLAVGLSSWIIQDGNYGEFSRGTDTSFALEFFAPGGLKPIDAGGEQPKPALNRIGYGELTYETICKVAFADDEWWVLDAGVLLFQDAKPPEHALAGTWLSGNVQIGVDPFMYFERLSARPNVPALIYDWHIEKIEIQTAPFVPVGERRRERDNTKLGWSDIQRTDAWRDDDGHAEYILHCVRRETAPRTKLK